MNGDYNQAYVRLTMLRCIVAAGAIALVVAMPPDWRHVAGGASPATESPCRVAAAKQQWADASVACAGEAAATGDSALGVRGARALFYLGRYDEALDAARRWFGSAEDATARQIAGAVYLKRRELTPAIPLLRRALEQHSGRGDHEEAARDASYLTAALAQAGLLGEAFDAAAAAVQAADRTGEAHDRIRVSTRLALGKVLLEIGDFSAARDVFWKLEEQGALSPTDRAWVYLQLGLLRIGEGDNSSAASLFANALEGASKANVVQVAAAGRWGELARVVTAAHMNLAYVTCALGDLDAADAQMSHLADATRSEPTALMVDGLIAVGRGHRERGEQLLDRAERGGLADDYAIDVAVHRGLIAERAAELTNAEQHYRAAIALVEQLRQNTSDLELRPWILTRRHVPYRLLLSLLARQNHRADALAVAEQLHARTWADALLGRTGASGVHAQVTSATSLGWRLRGDAAKTLSSEELLALLRGREALVFAEAAPDIWRFHIVDGRVVQLDRLPDQTRALFDDWSKTPNDRTLADRLGAALIPPGARVRSDRPLYIVTSGTLDTLPFAALRPEGHYLIEDRVIARLPGIVVLRCRALHGARRSSVLLGDSRDNLPMARQETTTLAELLGGTAFVGPEATVERLEASRDASLLHLAVHADVDEKGARLLLANQQLVTAADVVRLNIGPRVAVLAGCATAVSRDAEGWGALSSAFLVAGSRSVVATLQSVPDTDAHEIMQRFYAFDGEHQPALALAKAQRELLEAGAAPSTWAPFVVHGSADAADCDNAQSY
jgi:tetratricopeptide (TPR) repeat protein